MLERNKTKENIVVQIGQIWQDLDKRMRDRQCKIIEVLDGKVKMQQIFPVMKERVTLVSVSRMHKMSTGWKLITAITDNLIPGTEEAWENGQLGNDERFVAKSEYSSAEDVNRALED
jgi:hypothetical protein